MINRIQKAVVIGSGTMGGGIAALLAGVDIETWMLDIPAPDSKAGDPVKERNAIVEANLKRLRKSRPPQLFSQLDLDNLHVGNIEDDLSVTADADWIIEVVVEKLEIKQSLMEKLAEVANPEAIISTNTSGIPLREIADNLDESFKNRFLGTHFFNPPRYLKLLELIPHENTNPEIVDFMADFASKVLGKGVVVCKDTPNFIGNRFLSVLAMQALNYALDNDYTVEEVDALTGPLISRPRTATFNLNDLVGWDVMADISRNLYPAIPDDEDREVLVHEEAQKLSETLLESNWLGRKSGKGFFWMKRDGGKKEFWALNLKTGEHDAPSQVNFDSVNRHGKVKPLGERLRLLIHADDRAGKFLLNHLAFYLTYAAKRIPEIADSLVNIDNAMKWGFAHQMGPFEMWDAMGVTDSIALFEGAGYVIPQWVQKMLDSGQATFYQYEGDKAVGYYSPQDERISPLPTDENVIRVVDLQADNCQLAQNDGGTIYDMGDGVLLWEFTSKQNTLTKPFMEIGWQAVELLKDDKYKALVVGNDARRFSIGANLNDFLENSIEEIDQFLADLQNLAMALTYHKKPVVTAPFDMALGGGNEILMAGTKRVSHMELAAGLVEIGVGVLPSGSGTKELVRRLVNPLARAKSNILPGLETAIDNILFAKVSESAKHAKELGYLLPDDRIVMNRDNLLWEAKQIALGLAQSYLPLQPEKVYAAGKDAYGTLLVRIDTYREAGYLTDYDAVIGKKVSYILTGGALSEPQWVSQQYLLDLERQMFLEIVQEEKSRERMQYMLANNKPLKN